MEIKNYGFVEPQITEDNFLFGEKASLPRDVINPSGDWKKYIPSFEPQKKHFETSNCAGFNTNIPIRMLLKKLGIEFNPSDRFTGIIAGTVEDSGNDPHTVAQAIRHYGMIPEEMLPFSNDIQDGKEYYSFKGASKDECIAEGKKWLEKYKFGHEWVFKKGQVNKAKMLKALRYSPLGVSVVAWQKRDGLYYKEEGQRDGHWTAMIVGYVEDKYWLILDTYINDGEPVKKLEWDYPFSYCKRYSISLRSNFIEPKKLSLLEQIRRYLQRLKYGILKTV